MRRNCRTTLCTACSPNSVSGHCICLHHPCLSLSERYRLAITAFAARRRDVSHRRCDGLKFRRTLIIIFYLRPCLQKYAGTRIETILYIVLKFQADRFCLRREPCAKFGVKLE